MQVEVTQDQLDTMATQNENFDNNIAVSDDTVEQKPLSEKDYRNAMAKALKERKEVIRRNKELIADKELEVSYWKAEADLMRYRFEKMDFFLKNLEIEPKYLQQVEALKERENQNIVESKPILD
jgi:hypothetical protein